MSDFQQRLEAELLAAANRPTRLRLARLPAIARAGDAAIGTVVLVALVAMAAFLVAVRPGERSGGAAAGRTPVTTTASPLAATPIPGQSLSLPDVLDPSTSTTLAAQGGHLTAVVFTASWCQPCMNQAPQLRTLIDHGVTVLLVSSLEPLIDARHAAQTTLSGAGRMVQDPGRRLGRALGVRSYPETILIKDGLVYSRRHGPIANSVVRSIIHQPGFDTNARDTTK